MNTSSAAAARPHGSSAGRRRALVLGSGGVLGFAWLLGALSALEEETGVDVGGFDTVIGTSAGSVAAALIGCGLSVPEITRNHRGLTEPGDLEIEYDHERAVEAAPPRPGLRPSAPRLALAGLRHPRRVRPLVALAGLLPTGRASLSAVHGLVERVASETGHADHWPTAPRPWIVAADYASGHRVIFGRDRFGPGVDGLPRSVRTARLADAVQASCSIPGWYPPTMIDGVPYVDGGAVSVTSVDALRHTGADEAYVLAPMASTAPDRPRGASARMERGVRRFVTSRIQADVDRLRRDGMSVTFLTPGAADLGLMGVNMMDPRRRAEVLAAARISAAAQLARA